jgi:hypothetical protein
MMYPTFEYEFIEPRHGYNVTAVIRIDWYDSGYASTWDEEGYGPEVEFTVCNHRGQLAPYIEKRMSQRHIDAITDMALDIMAQDAEEDYYP